LRSPGGEAGARAEPQHPSTIPSGQRGREGCRRLATDERPVATLDRGFRGEPVEADPFGRRKRLVTDEVIEGTSETGGDDLQGPNRWSNQPGFDLADEALGELLARELRLAHPELVTCGPPALAPRRRRLDGLRPT